MSTQNPLLVSVAPEIIGIMQALEAFDNAMGPDPAQWALNFAPAKLTLDGAVLKQLQNTAPALGSLAVSGLNGVWAGIISKVTAATTPAAPSAS